MTTKTKVTNTLAKDLKVDDTIYFELLEKHLTLNGLTIKNVSRSNVTQWAKCCDKVASEIKIKILSSIGRLQ